ncbi:MAG: TIGR03915 family putative DNA repair protein [Deltaproteobacteria bacterium]|jgi:probable DNA metabolism protein|nr:TIGR03915 family putative DNA repair protein [Deltaproteobacteria bacterium]
MQAFLYDQTFEGLLSAVFDAYSLKVFPDALLSADALTLVSASHEVLTGRDKALRVWKGLAARLSPNALGSLAYAWLGEEQGRDVRLFRCMRRVFDGQASPETDLSDPDITAVFRLARKVNSEALKLQGFARFQKSAQGIYFSAVNPRHNVLPLLLPHFAGRFPDQRWILYDAGRGYGFFRVGGEYREIIPDTACLEQNRLREDLLAEGEKLFQSLWRNYCRALVIKERLNPALQSRCMPRRYWPYLTEMRPDDPAAL